MLHRSTLLRSLALAVTTIAALATQSGSASASGTGLGIACPTPTSTPFAPWGDHASYAFAPDGGLESGAAGWTLAGGARVVTGNEPWHVSGPGNHSLDLPAGSSATSAPMCIGVFSDGMRFFAQNLGGSGSRLHVQVIYGGGVGGVIGSLGGTLGISDRATLSAGSVWDPTRSVGMAGGLVPVFTRYVQFRITPTGGTWRIDDLYLDPLMHR